METMRSRSTISEAEATSRWVSLLSGGWTIEHQVSGVSPGGKRYRMDMLLHPRFDWPSGGRHPIGLEIKRPSPGVDVFTKALAQATDYTRATWKSSHRPGADLEVYVAILDAYTGDLDPCCQSLADRIVGRQNVGFFRTTRVWSGGQDLALFTAGHRRWSLLDGVIKAPFNAIPKRGSR